MAMEEERKTQRELILEHLKAEGYDIATERVKEKSKRTGRTVQYALYRLGGAAKPKEGG